MVVNSVWLLNCQNNYLFSLHQKVSVEILTARYRPYFHKKIYRNLCKSNRFFKPISILWWIDRISVEKASNISWAMIEHILTIIFEKKRCWIAAFFPSVVFHTETAIWFALQSMPGFYMECYTGMKWFRREYSLLQILNLSLPKCF